MNIETDKYPPKPPYLLGLLCLIPFLGGLAGITLLVLGIVYYKNVWFSLIGGAGIILGIAAWLIAFSMVWHTSGVKNGFLQLSQMQLNELVKDVEFYKLQHGEYPYSLKQLSTHNAFANITDPSQAFNRHNIYYNYKKIGDKYTLFSSGADGLPNTKDDMYPQIAISDSSKIGLIKQDDK